MSLNFSNMLKRIMVLPLLCLAILSCREKSPGAGQAAVETDTAKPAAAYGADTAVVPQNHPKQYSSVEAMIDSSTEFSKKKGTFKVLAANPLHVQVSAEVMNQLSEDMLNKIALKSIVYIAYKAFATTGVQELTITSVPCVLDMKTGKAAYRNEYRAMATISRDKAKKVMEELLGTGDFSLLLTSGHTASKGAFKEVDKQGNKVPANGADVPSEQFEALLSLNTLPNMFAALQQP